MRSSLGHLVPSPGPVGHQSQVRMEEGGGRELLMSVMLIAQLEVELRVFGA